jgi:hypothetical protein
MSRIIALAALLTLAGSSPHPVCWSEQMMTMRDDAGRDFNPQNVTFCRGGTERELREALLR